MIQVTAVTDAYVAAYDEVVIRRAASGRPHAPPRLHLLAVGIDTYHDPDIPPLQYSVADAKAVIELMQEHGAGVYKPGEINLLTNRHATPERWRQTLQDLSEKIKTTTQPDDLVVLFLAGHGVLDRKTQRYYFIGYDFPLTALEAGNFSRCLSCDDFRALSDIPCRKLVLLDTCHSGAVQPLQTRSLKSAVRELQADVIFTVTASTGEQKSAEKEEWSHGAFTKCLLEVLDGRAGPPPNGIVRLDAVISWVKQAVPQLTDGFQTPTAAPEAFLHHTTIPLTRP